MRLAGFSLFPRRRCSPRLPPAISRIPLSHHSWPDPACNEPLNLAAPSTRISNDKSARVEKLVLPRFFVSSRYCSNECLCNIPPNLRLSAPRARPVRIGQEVLRADRPFEIDRQADTPRVR